jgi:hypothetical protein
LKRRKGVMAIKVDLKKAYDRFWWDFIRNTLILAGISRSMVGIIMKCIETIYLSVLWNKSPLEKFLLARESVKGDPLSLYILVLCLEHLSQLIHREGKKKISFMLCRWYVIVCGSKWGAIARLSKTHFWHGTENTK